MTNNKAINPYDSFRRMSEMWEKGFNGLLFQSIDNNGLIQMTKFGLDAHSRYIEILKKNSELMAGLMNISTKIDVANVAKLTLQTEEKIDLLEEHVWNLQENFTLAFEEQQKMLGELIETNKKMYLEWQKALVQLDQLTDIKKEFEAMKELLKEKQEPVLTSSK
nr:hypothetical protein [Neobacillus sp. Marseille-Q6967]